MSELRFTTAEGRIQRDGPPGLHRIRWESFPEEVSVLFLKKRLVLARKKEEGVLGLRW